MICDIIIRSYYKDFKWLRYCLKSIDKFCRGFRDVIVVVPRSSLQRFIWMGFASREHFVCPDYRDDYLGQQISKLYADTISDADYICHVDSDCVFHRLCKPSDMADDGKPQVVMASYDLLAPQCLWRDVTGKFLRQEVEYDFMRRQPLIYPGWIYGELRDHTLALHGMKLEDYVAAQPCRGFSEFNALGAFGYYNYPRSFSWIPTSSRKYHQEFCRWFWSWGGITSNIRREIERILS